MRWGLLVGAGFALIAAAGALSGPGDSRSAGGAPAADEPPSERSAGLGASTSAAPTHPSPEMPPLPSDVQAALEWMLLVTNDTDADLVQDAIRRLARVLCVDGGAHTAVLQRVLSARDGSERARRAVFLALGRCHREDVLHGLVRSLRDPAAGPLDRESIVLALAQPRQLEFDPPDGVVASGIGDANLAGPIGERFVLDALLEVLLDVRADTDHDPTRESFEEYKARAGLRATCIRALAGSASDAPDVLDALVTLARSDPKSRGTVLSWLFAARPSARLTACVQPFVEDHSASDATLQGGLAVWMRGDYSHATDYVLSELAAADVPDGRKALLVRYAQVRAPWNVDTFDVERLAIAAVEWARDHPRVVTSHEQSAGSRGPATTPVELDMLDVVDGFLSSAFLASQGRSEPLRRLAADSLVARLSRTSTTKERRHPPNWFAYRFEGDDDYLLLVLRGLRSAPLGDDTLLDVADLLTAPRPGRPPRSAAVLTAITPITDRLSPALRDRLATRRAPK